MRTPIIAAALLLAAGGGAFAADLAPPPLAPPAAYDWTGVYLGANGGYAFGGSSWAESVTGGASGNFTISGLLFGGTVGANFQTGSLVLGVEGDGAWTDISGAGTFTSTGLCAGGCNTSNTWLATARGRIGYAFDRFLVYATGGAAFGNVQAGYSNHPATNVTETGWTIGAGLEVAVIGNWTAKVEYLFVDLPNGACTTDCAIANPGGGPPTIPNVAVTFNESIVRAGVNYKFGW